MCIFTSEAVVWRCSAKNVFLEILQNSPENACARVSFNFIKEDAPAQMAPAQVFSCEFCEIFWNSFSYRTPQVAASEVIYMIQSAREKYP